MDFFWGVCGDLESLEDMHILDKHRKSKHSSALIPFDP